MSDYFSEYSSFIGNKGLPSPIDTPYETPSFIRSKRSSRATTTGSRSRNASSSPPPLPPDATDFADKPRDGRYTALDPRRFTPTLHASLVAEILSLRRELDSKNHLVENLESGLASVKNENDQLNDQLLASAKEVRVARAQVNQMENGTYEAVEAIAREQSLAQAQATELKGKLDTAQRKMKLQDDDAERTQTIWDREKESWENERRQLERRIHVTETRLRKFVDEMVSQRPVETVKVAEEVEDESIFKDSGLGNESDNSVTTEPMEHRRGASIASFKSSRNQRYSLRDQPSRLAQTPEPLMKNGISLADELGDDDGDYDEADDVRSDDDIDYHDAVRRTMDSRQSHADSGESKAKRVLGIEDMPPSPIKSDMGRKSFDQSVEQVRQSPKQLSGALQIQDFAPHKTAEGVHILTPLHEVSGSELDAESLRRLSRRFDYVDNGYQPSPPTSPVLTKALPSTVVKDENRKSIGRVSIPAVFDTVRATEKPVEQAALVIPAYTNGSTQTDIEENKPAPVLSKDSLQQPMLVPAIAIHAPTSRPQTPRQYALPPGTKNASTQATLPWSCRHASIQTEEIRLDLRTIKLPPHLRRSYLDKADTSMPPVRVEREAGPGIATILSTDVINPSAAAAQPAPKAQSPVESTAASLSRNGSVKDLWSMPLKALPLPKPALAPAFSMNESSNGPLNRGGQFGVSHTNRSSRLVLNLEDSEASDNDVDEEFFVRSNLPSSQRAGRFPAVTHPRNVPEDKELSPERRPATAESVNGAALAPSIASSREIREHQRLRKRPPPKINTYATLRSRSPSFGSASDSNFSLPGGMPYPIPTRSSSRQLPPAFSDGPYSPVDPFAAPSRSSRSHASRQRSLRKAQSSTALRENKTRRSPHKSRRRMRSPDLTPVQSMAFDSPAPTNFPIPELPTPLQRGPASDYQWSVKPSGASMSSIPADEHGLIDAIAGTMVGEWMWKYIRKRKSFGVTESTDDFTQLGENGVVDISGVGTRHKRWVWLSPYERTIMWDSKQPMTGNALLGKKGRKLTIQAVIDVKDDTPLPRKPELDNAYYRSILVLTPARALKFTATTAERHRLWMNALSFLADSTQQQTALPPAVAAPAAPSRAPPPPPIRSRPRKASPSLGRANVRDSVRLAKVKEPESRRLNSAADSYSVGSEEPPRDEGADFPAIPRLYSSTTRHQRKRSNTSPRLPPALNNLRSFSSSAAPASHTANGLGQATIHLNGSNNSTTAGRPSVTPLNMGGSSYSGGSRSASAASPAELTSASNFFEATGTVRMEAFVDPNVKNGVLYLPAPPSSTNAVETSANGIAAVPRRKRGDSNLSTTTVDKRRAGYVFDDNGLDPFKGF